MEQVWSLSQADFGCQESASEADRDVVDELGGRSAVFIRSTDSYCTLLRLTGRTNTRTTPTSTCAVAMATPPGWPAFGVKGLLCPECGN